jgi:hypothetical protein
MPDCLKGHKIMFEADFICEGFKLLLQLLKSEVSAHFLLLFQLLASIVTANDELGLFLRATTASSLCQNLFDIKSFSIHDSLH